MNVYFTYESRDTPKSFSVFLTVKDISKLNMERTVKLKDINLKKLAFVVHVLQTTESLILSPCCFVEDV